MSMNCFKSPGKSSRDKIDAEVHELKHANELDNPGTVANYFAHSSSGEN